MTCSLGNCCSIHLSYEGESRFRLDFPGFCSQSGALLVPANRTCTPARSTDLRQMYTDRWPQEAYLTTSTPTRDAVKNSTRGRAGKKWRKPHEDFPLFPRRLGEEAKLGTLLPIA